MKKLKLSKAVCAVSCTLAFAWSTPNTVLATPIYDTFGPLPEATFGGQGIPNDEVAVSDQVVNGNTTLTIAMSATQRYSNPPLTNDGAGTYFATTGSNFGGANESTTEGALWNFNFYVDVAGTDGLELTDFQIDMYYDFDPAFDNGPTGLGVIDVTALLNCGIPCLGVAPPTNTLEDSQNLLFSFLDTPFSYDFGGSTGVVPIITPPTYPSFDPDALGEYNFAIQVTRSGWNIDTVAMDVQVVPVPAAVWLFASGFLGLVGISRRKNSVH
jgi:hypothetical protein